MDAQSHRILGVLIALGALLLVGAALARQFTPLPSPVTGAPDLLDVALTHEQQRNVNLVIAVAAREGANGEIPTIVVPRDLDDPDVYGPDTYEGVSRPALAAWILQRMTGGRLEEVDYDPSWTPSPPSGAETVPYPLGVTRIGDGERYVLYWGEGPDEIVLVAESIIAIGSTP